MSHIDDVIAKCAEVLANKDEKAAEDLLDAIPFAYQFEIPRIFDGLSYYDELRSTRIFDDLAKLEATLRAYREKREYDMRIAELHASAITVQAISESKSESSVSITLDQAMEQIDDIDESALSESEKAELKALMLDVDASKRKGKDRLLAATKEVVGWVCDRGIESLPTVLNYAMQAAQSIM